MCMRHVYVQARYICRWYLINTRSSFSFITTSLSIENSKRSNTKAKLRYQWSVAHFVMGNFKAVSYTAAGHWRRSWMSPGEGGWRGGGWGWGAYWEAWGQAWRKSMKRSMRTSMKDKHEWQAWRTSMKEKH